MLVVDHIEVKPGNIRLLMMFNDQKVDVPVATWTQLKKDYENDNPLKLEEFLFFKMVHLMKVLAEQTILEIFDKNRNSSFYSETYMENEELKIESSFLKSVKKDIVIEKIDYRGISCLYINFSIFRFLFFRLCISGQPVELQPNIKNNQRSFIWDIPIFSMK